MAYYYFHIRSDGLFVSDDEGMELLDVGAARIELLASAKDLVMAAMRAGHGVGNDTIEVEDAEGNLLDAVWIRRVLH